MDYKYTDNDEIDEEEQKVEINHLITEEQKPESPSYKNQTWSIPQV